MFLRRKKIQAGIIFGHLLVRRYSLFTILFLLAILIACSLSGNIKAQGIQGQVVESFSRQGIRGVVIGIYHGDSLLTQLSSKPSGLYNVKCKWAGRVSVRITHKDFMEIVEQDIILDGYS